MANGGITFLDADPSKRQFWMRRFNLGFHCCEMGLRYMVQDAGEDYAPLSRLFRFSIGWITWFISECVNLALPPPIVFTFNKPITYLLEQPELSAHSFLGGQFKKLRHMNGAAKALGEESEIISTGGVARKVLRAVYRKFKSFAQPTHHSPSMITFITKQATLRYGNFPKLWILVL